MSAKVLACIAATAFCVFAVIWQQQDGYTGADPWILQIGLPPEDPKDDSCDVLNRLEVEAMVWGHGAGNVYWGHMSKYEAALGAWRRQHPGYQPLCRTRALGKLLCSDGSDVLGLLGRASGDAWDEWMRELAAHESTDEDCENFWKRMVPEKWLPHVFHWPQETQEVILDEILRDGDYGSAYASAMHLAPPFGAPQISFRQRPQGRFQMHRVEQLNHWRVLRKIASGIDMGNLSQIVEFGGGNGNLPAQNLDLGFKGVHYVYDFPTMILMQRYWLQYSGIPAVLGRALPKTTQTRSSTGNMRTILENALSDELENHIDKKLLPSSMFVATYSFTEADMGSRAKIWKVAKECAVIQIAHWANFYGKDNMEHIRKLVETDLKHTHRVLWWMMPPGWHATSGKAYYLVAVRKDFGIEGLRCSADVGCSEETTVINV